MVPAIDNMVKHLTVRVLCTGDIHIGRRSSKVRDVLRSVDAWKLIVDKAIELEVDLVALSGDLIDKENKSYEALGPMQHGLLRLCEAGIETVAVTGNHDHDVLPRLASITKSNRFHLLGTQGEWERFTFHKAGSAQLHIDGWSFTSEHIHTAPLSTYRTYPDDGIPVMGLLHGDFGNSKSSYAPIHAEELWAQPFTFTLLGHIHLPRGIKGPEGKQALYPGSPFALDPGEPGVHGCWIVEIDNHNSVSMQQLPLSPVRYASTSLNLDDVSSESEFQLKLSEALHTLARISTEEYKQNYLQVVSARIHCTGKSSAYNIVDSWITQAINDLGQFPVGAIHVEVDKITSTVRPPIDLTTLAQGSDPVAETAKILLSLDDDEPDAPYRNLVDDTIREMSSITAHAAYASLRSAEDEDTNSTVEEAKTILKERAWGILSQLVSQKDQA